MNHINMSYKEHCYHNIIGRLPKICLNFNIKGCMINERKLLRDLRKNNQGGTEDDSNGYKNK